MGAGSEISIPNDAQIRFIGQNGFDTVTDMIFTGANYSLQFINDQGYRFGFWGNDFIIPYNKIAVDNGSGQTSNHYINLADDSGNYRMYYSGYVGSLEYDGATAHYFTATGSNLPADGGFMRGLHMANPGHIFGITYHGDLEIGSDETETDHDTYLKFRGKDNSCTIEYDQSEDVLHFGKSTGRIAASKNITMLEID
jgi:hypothetical protein